MAAEESTVSVGTIVTLQRGFIGVVKWIGQLPGSDGKYFVGVKLSEGSGDCDGTFRAVRYFKCEENRGIFVPKEEVKRIISPEELLNRLVESHKRVKRQTAEILKYKEEIENLRSPEHESRARAAMQSLSASTPIIRENDHSDEAVNLFLENEIRKGWYCTLHDLYVRYPNRSLGELSALFRPHEANFNKMQPKEGHTRIVYTVCTSKKDNLIASGSDDKTIRLWRITGHSEPSQEARCITQLKLRSCINSLAFSPNGDLLAAALDSGWIEFYNIATGKNMGALEGQTTSEVWTICFSPDGKRIISGALDRAVRIWDVDSRECNWALRGHDEWVNGVAIAPNGNAIVSAGGDKTVRVWDTRNMNCKATLRGHTDFVRSVAVLEDNRTVVSASDDTKLRRWDMETGTCTGMLNGHTKGIYSVAAGPGMHVASASRDCTVKLWDVNEVTCLETFEGHNGDVNSCAFTARGDFLISGSDDKSVQVFPTNLLEQRTR